MKNLKSHPIIEGIQMESNIDKIGEIHDIFVNLEDDFDLKVAVRFFKYDGVADSGKFQFTIYDQDGKELTKYESVNEKNTDMWQVIFSGDEKDPDNLHRIHLTSVKMIDQVVSLTGLKFINDSSRIAAPVYSTMKIKTFKFDQDINFKSLKVDSITGLVVFKKEI